jgi:tetratricopeptide (TPR) repeat protein
MENLELLDQYIDNQLMPVQITQLEKDLQQDAGLQRLLDNVVISREAIRYRALTMKVKGLHQQYIGEVRADPDQDYDLGVIRPMPVRRDYSWVLRIAASVLIALFGYGSYQYATLDKSQVYTNKFISYQLLTTRGSADQLSPLRSAYLSGNYGFVIQQFSSLPTKAPIDYFLTGVAYLQQHEYTQAINRFTELRAVNKRQQVIYFNEETDYYLALAYLGAGRLDESYSLFKSIHDAPRHLFRESVTELDLVRLNVLRLKEVPVSGK